MFPGSVSKTENDAPRENTHHKKSRTNTAEEEGQAEVWYNGRAMGGLRCRWAYYDRRGLKCARKSRKMGCVVVYVRVGGWQGARVN